MPNYATLQISDVSPPLGEAASHVIRFRPVGAGPISIRSVAHPQTSPLRSEVTPALLGKLELRAPGRTAPVQTSSAGLTAGALALGYNATAADLAVAGDWICRITNDTLNNIVFNTDIHYLGNYELRTATFDIELLNLILAEAMAFGQISVHLQSTGADDRDHRGYSYASWSPFLAGLLPAPYKGTTQYRFKVDDPKARDCTFRMVGLDAHSVKLFAPASPEFVVQITFDTPSNPALKKLDGHFYIGDIDISSLQLNIHFGFDGNISVDCQTLASVDILGGATATGATDDVKSGFEQSTKDQISARMSPQQLKQVLDGLFIRLMRLSAPPPARIGPALIQYETKIQSYGVDTNGALVVTYYSVPQQPSAEYTHVITEPAQPAPPPSPTPPPAPHPTPGRTGPITPQ